MELKVNKETTVSILKDMIRYKMVDIGQLSCDNTIDRLEEEVYALDSAIKLIEFMEYSV
jgi:hypothetical protein